MNELLSDLKCTIENAIWLQILVHLTHSVEWMQFYRSFAQRNTSYRYYISLNMYFIVCKSK